MTSETRIALALAAVADIPDQELAERGAKGFKKMIERKRKYAHAARILVIANEKLLAELNATKAKLADVTKAYDELLGSMQVTDTSEAQALLSSLTKKPE